MNLLFLTDSLIPSKRASGIHVRKLLPKLADYFDQVVLLSQAGDKSLWSLEGVRHEVVRLPALKGGLYWMIWLFRARLKKLQCDVIYSRFVLVPFVTRKKPYVIELHDDSWNKGAIFRKAFKKAIKSPSCLGFVCITHALKEDFQATFGSHKSTVVIEDAAAVPVAAYNPTWENKERLTLTYIGSFHQGKGMELIIPMTNQCPDHDFVIIGGNEKDIAQAKLAVKGTNVTFKGFVDHDQIWQHLQTTDICLLPNQPSVKTGKKSDIGKYTSPLKMFEYMAHARPFIASDLPVLREVLDDEIAMVVAHDKVKAWIDAITALKDVALRERMGKAGFERFQNLYTWEKRAEKIHQFIQDRLIA